MFRFLLLLFLSWDKMYYKKKSFYFFLYLFKVPKQFIILDQNTQMPNVLSYNSTFRIIIDIQWCGLLMGTDQLTKNNEERWMEFNNHH